MMEDNCLKGHGFFRRAIIILAMVAEKEVFQKNGKIFWEIKCFPYFFFNFLYSNKDVAEESTLVGIIERSSISKFINLAYVMEDGTGSEEINIQPFIVTGVFLNKLGYGESVLQEPPEIGMVHLLGSGGLLKLIEK